MQRPTGVTILAILAAIGGVLVICGSLALIGLGGLVGGVIGSRLGTNVGFLVGGLGTLVGVVTLIVGLLELAFAVGAWNLRPWAWIIGVVSQIIAGVLAIVRLIDARGFVSSEVVTIAIAAIILYYLFTPTVKKAFGQA